MPELSIQLKNVPAVIKSASSVKSYPTSGNFSKHHPLPALLPKALQSGAGFHSESKAKEYKTACRKACIKAVAELREGVCALSAVTTALVELENSPITNAGTGSNLNIEGETECDASVMDGKTLNFAAVGALQGIKNPILVARKILLESEKGKLPAGRIPPCFLVGDGAYKWAMAQGMASSTAAALTTRQSMASFKKNKRKLELADQLQNPQKRRSSNLTSDIYQPAMDTVGAVILDSCGQVAAAVSSGGLAMKYPGRIGQAAVYGCGCWAERANGTNAFSSASSTSGCGEQLVRTMLARECTCAMQKEDAHQALLETMQDKFIYSPFLTAEDSVLGGVIVLRCQESSENCEVGSGSRAFMVEFLWAHTTDSMCVGYMSTQDGKPQTSISRLPPEVSTGRSVAIEGGVCRLYNQST
uniref:threonine aspartase 1 isoform X2 n=1 Tax=Myxine glutinosa TaxID=7769 RepID=UPI00358F6773